MMYKEEVKDLFTVPQGYNLAHCISADFNLGGGIAKQFCTHFNMRERLLNYYGDAVEGAGFALTISNVYNLVTKEKVSDRPTYENLINALTDMKEDMVATGVKKIAMPKIGCGLDRLNWNIVRSIIKEVFEDTDIEILICIREDEKEQEDAEEDMEEDEINQDFLDILQAALDLFSKK